MAFWNEGSQLQLLLKTNAGKDPSTNTWNPGGTLCWIIMMQYIHWDWQRIYDSTWVKAPLNDCKDAKNSLPIGAIRALSLRQANSDTSVHPFFILQVRAQIALLKHSLPPSTISHLRLIALSSSWHPCLQPEVNPTPSLHATLNPFLYPIYCSAFCPICCQLYLPFPICHMAYTKAAHATCFTCPAGSSPLH